MSPRVKKLNDPDKSFLGWLVKYVFIPLLLVIIPAYVTLVVAKIPPFYSPISSTATPTETPATPAIFASNTPIPTQTFIPTLDVSNWKPMYPTSLTDNRYRWTSTTSEQFGKWETSIDNSVFNIRFTAKTNNTWNTLTPTLNVPQDFYFGAEINLVEYSQGDIASIVFRRTDADHYYTFGLTSYDSFQVKKFNSGNYPIPIPFKKSSYLHYGEYNTLAILGIGSDFQFYINGYCVGKMSDSDFASGIIGFHGELAKSGDVLRFEARNAELRVPQKVSDDSCPDN